MSEGEMARSIVRIGSSQEHKWDPVSFDKTKADSPSGTMHPFSGPAFARRRDRSEVGSTLDNTKRAIRAIGLECRHDVFHDKLQVQGHSLVERIHGIDNICLKIRDLIFQQYGFDPLSSNTLDAIRLLSLENQFDPVRDYLEAIAWDGLQRLDSFLARYFGAENNALNAAIGRTMLVAGARRVIEPGCKFDHMVVLEGEQGSGKSSGLKILAGEANFSDADILSADARQQQEILQGVWIHEVAELVGLGRSDVGKLKSFISRTHDKARPAYTRSVVERPRRGILVGTTNDAEYLRDSTGNRRFWPVRTGVIDLEALRRDRDQLWAEAAKAAMEGEELTIPPELWPAAAERQKSRVTPDPWEDTLAAAMESDPHLGGAIVAISGELRVSTNSLYEALDIEPRSRSNVFARRLAAVMQTLGWKPGLMRFNANGNPQRGYWRLADPAIPKM
jgi:putative DNA primase/helicase